MDELSTKKVLLFSVLVCFLFALVGCSTNGVEDKAAILNSLEISQTPGSIDKIQKGLTLDFIAVGRDSNGNIIDVDPEWVVVGDEIGSFDKETGMAVTFTATEVGTGQIYAKAGEITSNQIELEVVDVCDSIVLTPSSSLAITGQSITLTAYGLSSGELVKISPEWSIDGSSGSLDAQIGEQVTFNANATGTSTITAELYGVRASATINVVEASGVGFVSGTVTNGRGGPAVGGVLVESRSFATTTDPDGYFTIPITADTATDIILSKVRFGNVRIQDVLVEADQELNLEVPIREDFHADWSHQPPVVSVVNQDTENEIQAGDVLSDTVNLDLSITSDNDLFVYYVYLGGEQRFPCENEIEVGAGEGSVTIDTTLYPDGPTYLRVLAYDRNENTTLYIVPIVIDNTVNDDTVPEAISSLQVYSITLGQNIGYYSAGREKLYEEMDVEGDPSILELSSGKKIDLEAAPPDATLFIELEWDPVENADGYKVYRSFDQTNYQYIGAIAGRSYYSDFSPQLAVGKTTYYRLIPYNSAGEGEAFDTFVTPLPPINVYLESPANQATGVTLTPTFTWRIESYSPLPEEIATYSILSLYDGTAFFMGEEVVVNAEEYTLTQMLQPGGVYSWDVYYAEVGLLNYYDASSYSVAYSVAGNGNGSANGEFIFTTTTEVE